MSYQVLTNFKSGLDKRKMELSSSENSLLTCKNALINRGGDIEVAKDFVEKYSLETGKTFGLHAVGNTLYCFGSGTEPATQPAGITYQRLQYSPAGAMTEIIDVENFDGKMYVVAKFADGSKHHFYDGSRVTDWDTLNTVAENNNDIAEIFKLRIDAKLGFTATVVSNVVTITGDVGVDYSISATAVNKGAINNQTLTINQTQASSAEIEEVLSSSTFTVTAGTAGAGNAVTIVTVDGVDTFNASGGILWTTSHSNTAALIAAEINNQTSAPNYTATSSGADVIVKAVASTGATPNGYSVVATVTGDVQIDSQSGAVTCDPMAGGVTYAAAVAEINTATVGGTFESADEFTITLATEVFKISGSAGGAGTEALMTLKDKMYCTTASLLYFSKVGNPQGWGTGDGAGFINMSNQDAGSEQLVALGTYQNNIVAFSKKSTQIWFVDPDPVVNSQLQVLQNIGCVAANSVQSFGENDMFFLSDSGIRSIRARNNLNTAGVSDVGTLIDDLVIADMKAATPTQIANATSLIQPSDGRYWLAMGEKIYIFTYFPSSKISAWTILKPALAITDFAVKSDRVYARAGDKIYLYGGDDDDEYTAKEVVVEFPYVNSRTIASWKDFIGVDFITEGTWNAYFCTDYVDTENYNLAGVVEGTTLDDGDFVIIANAVAIKIKMVLKNAGENGKISALIIHYNKTEEPA